MMFFIKMRNVLGVMNKSSLMRGVESKPDFSSEKQSNRSTD